MNHPNRPVKNCRSCSNTIFRLRSWLFLFALLFIPAFNFAQLNDDFSDGDFTNSPTWSGNTENFVVNAGELQLTDLAPVITQSYLSTPNAMTDLNNKEWRIKINQTFSGSDANQSRIYLVSDASVLAYSGSNSAGVHGYFLKLGEGLSGDVIRFYKDDGAAITLLASGTTNISTSFDVRIKVTCDASGNWEVAVDPAAGENFSVEMTFSENTYTTSSSFGIICTYTSSNADNFFFDDIYAGNIIVDNVPPQLLSATATSSNTIDVLFNEPVDQLTAESLLAYSAVGLGNPTVAALDNANNALVHLTYGNTFVANQTYTLSVSGIEDISGNAMQAPETANFTWFVIAEPNYRDVVFNEILADPTPIVALPEAEFVEIHNVHPTSTFDLADWKFVNTTTETILPSFLLAPGAYLILCDDSNAGLFSSFGDVLSIPSFSALSNTGDSLTLVNANDMVIDIVNYSDAWFASTIKRDGGWSLELVNPNLPCQTSANWKEALNPSGGTPGEINSVYNLSPDTTPPTVASVHVVDGLHLFIQFSESMDTSGYSNPFWSIEPFNSTSAGAWNAMLDGVLVTMQSNMTAPNSYQLIMSGISDCSGNQIVAGVVDFTIGFTPQPGDIIINEIMADPDPVIGMPDAEYIEIRNNTNTLLDLSNVMLNAGTFSNQVLIQPSGFLVVANEANAALFANISNAAFMDAFPGLTNSGLELQMKLSDGTMFDIVNYDDTWYRDASKIDGGWSLERINPLAICSGRYNWKASANENGGTAGAENSVYSTASNGSPTVTNHGVLSASEIYIRFSESMQMSSANDININLATGNSVNSPVWNTDQDYLIYSTSTPIIPEQVYSLDITGLKDCDGNQANPILLSFLLGVEPDAGEIIINEIMADGTDGSQVASPKVDFVELHNKTSHVVELTHAKINDGFFTQQVIIYPDSFIVVTDDSSDPVLFFAYPNTAFMSNFPSLTESGMEIILTSDAGTIDRVNYTKAFYHDASKEGGGYSMELVNPNDPCSSTDNWKACVNVNGTSAGRKNSVYSVVPDTQAPVFSYVLGEPEESVTLVFNEPLGFESLSGLIWIVNGEVQENINPYINGTENNQLVLHFGQMENGVIYSFELTGLTDCWGNETNVVKSQFALAQTPIPGDLIINEILYNPRTGGYDFLEIYNNSSKTISLKDWKISDATNGVMNSPDVISDLNILFFPGEYFALTKDGRNLSSFYPGTHTDRIWTVPTMSDFSSDDKAFLILPDGSISDQLKYDDSFHYPLLNTTDGVSLERISFSRSSDDITNWHSASEFANFATPGYKNSQNELDIVAETSLQVDPEIFSPDNDGYKDVVTFSYKLDHVGYTGTMKIFDSEGRLVRNLMRGELLGTQGSISWDGFNEDKLKSSIGIYVIYFEAFNTEGDVVKSKKTCVLAHSLN